MILAKHQPCGCVVCTCEYEERCGGCGAKHCGTHPVGVFSQPLFDHAADHGALIREALVEAELRVDILTAACAAHRACCSEEHNPREGKLHGYCVVCGVSWPCETAKQFLVKPKERA
jgi:hypothetical protein